MHPPSMSPDRIDKEDAMANPNPQLQAALTQFAAQPGVTPDQAAQLAAAVTHDVRLLQRLNDDAAAGH